MSSDFDNTLAISSPPPARENGRQLESWPGNLREIWRSEKRRMRKHPRKKGQNASRDKEPSQKAHKRRAHRTRAAGVACAVRAEEVASASAQARFEAVAVARRR